MWVPFSGGVLGASTDTDGLDVRFFHGPVAVQTPTLNSISIRFL